MRILGTIAATSALLAACGQARQDAPAEAPANQSQSPEAGIEPSTNRVGEPADPSGAPVPETQAADKASVRPEPAGSSTAANPCMVQDDKALSVASVRALGTEPFWNAKVEGRCVTYSTPEDQKGTRIWTRFTPGPGGGTWSGKLDGGRFELRVRPQRGCSDGMSDKRYPLSADLVVGKETRTGCAEPA